MVMEAAASLSSSSLSVLRHGLVRATACCFVGGGGGSGGLAERMRWRRRAGAGDFRYDPLSYALNFDDGGDHGVVDGDVDDRAGARLHAFLLSSQLTRETGAAAVEAASGLEGERVW